jgi:hypothetical protein
VHFVCLRIISRLRGLELQIEQLAHDVQELKIENEELKRNTSSNPPYISATNHDRVSGNSVDANVEGDFVPTFSTSIQPRCVEEAACSEFSLRLIRYLKGDGAPPSLQRLHHYDSPKIHRCVGTVSSQNFPPLGEAQILVEAVLKFMYAPKPIYRTSVQPILKFW